MSYTESYNPEAWGTGIDIRFLGPTQAMIPYSQVVLGEVLPQGYLTDGGSIPARLCGFMRRFGKGLPAFLIHDKDYDPPPDKDGKKIRKYTRKEADQKLYDNLRICGVGPFRARTAYRAVRLGGWKSWDAGTRNGTINVKSNV